MKVIVIGGGATGLAVSYLLNRYNNADVTLIEASPSVGGLLSTFAVGNTRLEYFYHHFFTHDAEINWLLKELGLHERTIFRPSTMGVYCRGNIYPFDTPIDLLKFDAMGLGARIQFGLASLLLTYVPSFADDERRPALEWLRTWAGAEATETIWEPMHRAKFGKAAQRIPLAWLVGRLRQRVRSRSGIEEQLGYLEGSLQVLVDRLRRELKRQGTKIMVSTSVQGLLTEGGNVTGVLVPEGEISADLVVSTVPTPILAKIVADAHPGYADRLSDIEYMGAICTILALPESLSPVYWLNVAESGYDFGGVIEQTHLVPPEEYGGRHLVYLSNYLRPDDELWKMEDPELLSRQIDQLSVIFDRDVSDLMREKWVFRGRYAAPVTGLEFSDKIPRYDTPIPNLYMASMPHVYPDERSTNNSIRIAAAVLEEAGFDVSEVPEGSSLAATYGW